MNKYWIYLNSFEKIKKFVNITCHLNYELDLISGRYIVDGKSIMGVFSLDLTKPIELLIIDREDYYPRELEEFMVA